MEWDNLRTKGCVKVEGGAKELMAVGNALTFSEHLGVLGARMTEGAQKRVWQTMRSTCFEELELGGLPLPEGMKPTGDVTLGHIVITDSDHPNSEPHVLMQVVCKDEAGAGHIFGLLRSIHSVYEDGPKPLSHNGYYHLPI